jgi:hypothetical protein
MRLVEASQKSFYTGQCSSAMALGRSKSAIVFFSFDLGLTWRPAGYLSNVVSHRRLALRSGIRCVIKSHRRAAGPTYDLSEMRIGKPVSASSTIGALRTDEPKANKKLRYAALASAVPIVWIVSKVMRRPKKAPEPHESQKE